MDLSGALCNQNVFCRNKDSNFRLMQVSVDFDFYSTNLALCCRICACRDQDFSTVSN